MQNRLEKWRRPPGVGGRGWRDGGEGWGTLYY